MGILHRIVNKIERTIAEHDDVKKIKYLKKKGCVIGEGTRLTCGISNFGTEPYLIKIGKNCLIAGRFVTHDGGVSVLINLGHVDIGMEKMAPIVVGDNCYIGMGAVILQGVTLGDNVVIGADAIVTHDIPDNSVAVGVPAKVIENVEEYYLHAKEKGWFYPTANMSSEEKRKYCSEIGMGN